MRVLIVDDEPVARDRLAALIGELSDEDIEVVGHASDGVTALAQVRALQPDVMLLDIAMPEIDGFEVVRHLSDPKPLVIFQTAYGDHAIRAYEHDALDYVMKPVSRARLQQAIGRARRRLQERASREVPATLLAKIEAALSQPRAARRTRILVRHGAGHRALALRDIVRFEADEGLVFAITSAGRLLTDYTLNDLEGRLGGAFVRASRADLVQIDRIDRLTSNGDGSATLTMTDGAIVRVSRRRAADVRRALQ